MRFPNESLDDYKARIAKVPDPPVPVTLELTGETETVRPLAYWDGPATDGAAAGGILGRLSWFHQSLVMGGALTIITFLVGTALYLGLYGPPVDPDSDIAVVDAVVQPPDTLASADEGPMADLLMNDSTPSALDQVTPEPPAAKRRLASTRTPRPAFRPQPVAKLLLRDWLHPQPWVSEFVPTTLIIYVENGEIKTRTESRVTAAYRRSLTSN